MFALTLGVAVFVVIPLVIRGADFDYWVRDDVFFQMQHANGHFAASNEWFYHAGAVHRGGQYACFDVAAVWIQLHANSRALIQRFDSDSVARAF